MVRKDLPVQISKEQRDDLVNLTAALRSGEYAQCRGVLHVDSKFCAVGVACDVLLGEVGWVHVRDTGYYSYKGKTHNIPCELSDRLPIDWDRVVELNDCGQSFETIAIWLEKEYLGG